MRMAYIDRNGISYSRARIVQLRLAGAVALLCAAAAGLFLGSGDIALLDVCAALMGRADAAVAAIILDIRLPRVLMAGSAGAALALAGLSFQAVLKNPLAEPYILGISSGAAVGFIIAKTLACTVIGTEFATFCGGLVSLVFVWMLNGRRSAEGLLLSGVMLNAFCGALILLLLSLLRPGEASAVLSWFLGYLGYCDLATASWHCAALLPCCILLSCAGHCMNLMLLSEEEATSLGVPVPAVTMCLLGLASLMVSMVVASAGPLGFVGLVVPQALRCIVGADHRLLAAGCLFFGAAFLMLSDTVSRVIVPSSELPVGVVTALIGAPMFIMLLRRQAR